MTKKKSIWSMVLAICLIVPAIFMLAACNKDNGNNNNPPEHTHTYSSVWDRDGSYHWHNADCEHTDEKSDYAAHNFGSWSIKTPASLHHSAIEKRTCGTCNFEETRPVADSALHDYELKRDATGHWYECSCSKKKDFAGHTYNDWTEKTAAGENQDRQLSRTCSYCNYEEIKTFDNTKTNGTYCLAIEDRFVIEGKTYYQVKVLRGAIEVGDNVAIDGIDGEFGITEIIRNKVAVTGKVGCGEEVDLVLEGEDGATDDMDVCLIRNTLMYQPNSTQSYTTFTAVIKFDTNGASTPLYTGRPVDIDLYDTNVNMPQFKLAFPEGVSVARDGDVYIMTVTFEDSKARTLWAGMDFKCKVSSNVVATGTILSVGE